MRWKGFVVQFTESINRFTVLLYIAVRVENEHFEIHTLTIDEPKEGFQSLLQLPRPVFGVEQESTIWL